MKRYIVAIAVTWIVSVVLLLIYKPESDRGYMIEINRLHRELSQLVLVGHTIPPVESDVIQSVEAVKTNELTLEQRQIFLPIGLTDTFIRYTLKPQRQSHLPMIVLSSLTPLMALFILFKTHTDIIKPLRSMSEIPGRLAKGHLQYSVPQYKSKVFYPFLWSLDMLRAKLHDQKNINLGLEKERKTLVASLSHDIKTPISSIRSYSLAIKDGIYGTQEEIQDALDVIFEKTVRIERLTDELLESSVNAIEEITVDASGHYLSELYEAIDRTVRNRISLLKMEYHIDSPEQDYLVLTDIDKLIEVCDNIMENAVKYGDLGGLSVRFCNEEQCTLISFENTGGHIPKAEIKHVFTSFYRGSNVCRVPGHGLGLYIASKIMRAMEGDIYAENTDKGVVIVLVMKRI